MAKQNLISKYNEPINDFVWKIQAIDYESLERFLSVKQYSGCFDAFGATWYLSCY